MRPVWRGEALALGTIGGSGTNGIELETFRLLDHDIFRHPMNGCDLRMLCLDEICY